MQRPRHPLPARPDVTRGSLRPSQKGGPSTPTAQPYASANASGGYPGYNTGAYPHANASGGYQTYNAGGGYPGYNASGGYPGYNASGGYPGYGGWTGVGGGYVAPATPTGGHGGRGRGRGGGRGGHGGSTSERGDVSRATGTTKSEEEERWAKSGRTAFIQGTGIRLETPEEIAAWIAERRRKFPTKEKVEESKVEEEAARARGENPRKRKLDPARAAEEWGREAAPPPPPVHDRGRGGRGGMRGGRGRGGRGAAPTRPIPKTSDVSSSDSGSSDDSSDESDSESGSDSDVSGGEDEEGAGLDVKNDETNEAGADASTELKPADASSTNPPAPDQPEVCKFFARGKCRYGTRCRLAHVRVDDKVAWAREAPNVGAPPPGPPRPPAPRQPQPKRANPFARPSMLGALLANPIENTLSQLTQSIRFLVANDMLRGVEVRPGQGAEREQERHKITVLPVGEGGESGDSLPDTVKSHSEAPATDDTDLTGTTDASTIQEASTA